MRDRVRSDAALAARIRAKYRIKNTTGYGLNAFLDHELPADILQHLLIGSEGTLGFIAEAVLHTVPDLPVKYTGMLYFADVFAASAAVPALAVADAKAVELMDRASLASIAQAPGAPPVIAGLPAGAAALLVEFQAADASSRGDLEARAAETCAGLRLLMPARFTHDAHEQLGLWKLRKGLFTSVGAIRASGTTVIIEDVAFPAGHLAEATSDLHALFPKHGYDRSIIFGHAKDGNLHFVITQSFNDQAAIDRYARFIDDVVEMVVGRYDGSLKAEHGTGRNMAPFVETEWGPEAVAIMRELKALVDPDHLLNPGVILNDDPRAHLTHLKALPSIPTHADACIECGFCEGVCPSRHHTLTPRQRIVVERELERLAVAGDREALAALAHDAGHDVIDTCAGDSLCSTQCPVLIDTGALVKHLRHARHGRTASTLAAWTATHFDLAEAAVGVALRAGHLAARVIGDAGVRAISRLVGEGGAQWIAPMPRAARRTPTGGDAGHADVVFVTSCITRNMGEAALAGEVRREGEVSTAELFMTLCARAHVEVFVPDATGTCCGVPFSSKGFTEAHEIARTRLRRQLDTWSRGGAVPVVLDTSPCAHGVKHDLASATNGGASRPHGARRRRVRPRRPAAAPGDHAPARHGLRASRVLADRGWRGRQGARARRGVRRARRGAARRPMLRHGGRPRVLASRPDRLGHRAPRRGDARPAMRRRLRLQPDVQHRPGPGDRAPMGAPAGAGGTGDPMRVAHRGRDPRRTPVDDRAAQGCAGAHRAARGRGPYARQRQHGHCPGLAASVFGLVTLRVRIGAHGAAPLARARTPSTGGRCSCVV